MACPCGLSHMAVRRTEKMARRRAPFTTCDTPRDRRLCTVSDAKCTYESAYGYEANAVGVVCGEK